MQVYNNAPASRLSSSGSTDPDTSALITDADDVMRD